MLSARIHTWIPSDSSCRIILAFIKSIDWCTLNFYPVCISLSECWKADLIPNILITGDRPLITAALLLCAVLLKEGLSVFFLYPHENVPDAAFKCRFLFSSLFSELISDQSRTNRSFGDAEVTFGIHSKSPELLSRFLFLSLFPQVCFCFLPLPPRLGSFSMTTRWRVEEFGESTLVFVVFE